MEFKLPLLPPNAVLETKKVLQQLVKSHKSLAELKGIAKTIPNESILIDTLTLQEAKDSSAIENIVTTHDDLYKENILIESKNIAAKEVYNYKRGLALGYQILRQEKLLLNHHILAIQEKLIENKAGFRTQAGTKLVNAQGQVIYSPPQHRDEILDLMANLEKCINDDTFLKVDDLVKMAIIHYQFESIHPFYDGNGRTGRIINILYLVKQELLDIPILYLSRYIAENKAEYYKVLQEVRAHNWERLILYFLKSVEVTAKQTIALINAIKTLMQDFKIKLRTELPKIYSQDLLNILFKTPYTKTIFIEKELQVSKRTALNYLEAVVKIGLLKKIKAGKSNYYINLNLIDLLINIEKKQS